MGMSYSNVNMNKSVIDPSHEKEVNKPLQDVKQFVEESKKPGSLVQNICTTFPEARQEIEKQLETFHDDYKKLQEGKLSYSEMRAMYG